MLAPIPITDGEVLFDANFYTQEESESLFRALYKEIEWEQQEIKLFGKKVLQPRLHAWYGNPGLSYTYSGLEMHAKPWTQELIRVKDKIEQAFESRYNSVLINLYRDGKDSMGWHSDDERELGKNPTIASISLGGERRFHLKHKKDKSKDSIRIDLGNGSLLIMSGSTQHHWKHQISKTSKAVMPRINLTFRYVYS